VIVVAQGRDLDTLEAALEECIIGRAIELHCAGGCKRMAVQRVRTVAVLVRRFPPAGWFARRTQQGPQRPP
jgi:hypothetical protein